MKALVGCFIFLLLLPASDGRRHPEHLTFTTAHTGGVSRRLVMPAARTAAENAAALNRFFAITGSATVQIPAGTYLLPCGARFAAAGSLSIFGAGAGRTVLRLERACMLTGSVMAWTSKSNVELSGFTLDLNAGRTAALQSVLQFEAYQGNADGLRVDDIAIVNGSSLSLQIAVAAAGGFTYSNVALDGNRLEMKAGQTQNQCIALTTVGGTGQIPRARITNNTCRGSGIQVDGESPIVEGNDVSGYQFGTGIFLAFVERTGIIGADWSNGVATIRFHRANHSFTSGERIHIWGATPTGYNGTYSVDRVTAGSVSYSLPKNPGRYAGAAFAAPDPSSRNCIIRRNTLHDTAQTLDVNRTPPGGIENNCVDSLVEKNQAFNLGGAGFVNYASGARYLGNHAASVGYRGHGSAGGDGDNAAFTVSDNGTGMPWYRSTGLVFQNNSSEARGGRPRYGYFEEPWHLFGTTFLNNSFMAAERSMVVRKPSCRAAPLHC